MEKVYKNNSDTIKASKIEIQKFIDKLDNAINNLDDDIKKSYLKEKLFALLAGLSLFVGGALMFPATIEFALLFSGNITNDSEVATFLLSFFSAIVGYAVTNSNDIFIDKSVAYKNKAISLDNKKSQVVDSKNKVELAYNMLDEQERTEVAVNQVKKGESDDSYVKVEYEDSYTDELAVGFGLEQYCQQNGPRRVLLPKSE